MDFSGYAKIIKALKAEFADEKKKLAEETTSKEMLQQQLAEEKARHVGTKAEAARLRQLIARKLRNLKKTSTSVFENVETVFRDFQI